jgi:hypothetical protein
MVLFCYNSSKHQIDHKAGSYFACLVNWLHVESEYFFVSILEVKAEVYVFDRIEKNTTPKEGQKHQY